jgi:hypothetical protein
LNAESAEKCRGGRRESSNRKKLLTAREKLSTAREKLSTAREKLSTAREKLLTAKGAKVAQRTRRSPLGIDMDWKENLLKRRERREMPRRAQRKALNGGREKLLAAREKLLTAKGAKVAQRTRRSPLA